MQAKLLRAAGTGRNTRVGSTTVVKVDVRFVAATTGPSERREDRSFSPRISSIDCRVRADRAAAVRSQSEIEPLARKFLGDFAKDFRSDSLLTFRPMPWLSCFATTGRETSASFAT